ncbi:MAG: serine protease [Bacteroidetes bacterium]|nr:serine protease [Bacteroidota bacterium]
MEHLEPLLRSFWYVAIPASIIFLIQTIMTFTGTDAMDGAEADFDSDLSDTPTPFQLFSLRNLINFLLGFGWSGISFYDVIEQRWLLVTVALFFGLLFVVVFFIIIRQIKKLAEDNSFSFAQAEGKTAEVYLRIPGNKGGAGKVIISINGSTRELTAMTEGEEISSGAMVRVVQINQEILIVEKI